MNTKLAWGILGTGRIAGTFAKGLTTSKTGKLVAVGSRTRESAEKFGQEHQIANRHGSYEALVADPDVQAIYNSTPHPYHAEWAIKCAEAGKHVLCEKPIGLNHAQAMAIVEAARRNEVFLMEAFMYRCHPQTQKLVELIQEKSIGQVRLIKATFSFHAGFNAESRLYNNALGGGGILDVGCYVASMTRLIAGAATGLPFAEPLEFKGLGKVGQTGVDEYAVAVAKFPNDIVAQLATGVAAHQENIVQIFGTEGHIEVPDPWFCKQSTIEVHSNRNGKRSVLIECDQDLYAIEADTVAAGIAHGQAPYPAMSVADTLGNMKLLDEWRAQLGQRYEAEKLSTNIPTIHGRPLAVKTNHPMKYDTIPGIDLKISRLVIGCDYHSELPHTSVMLDEYFEQGGNCFDTGFIYGGGRSEKALGRWIQNRGIRDQVIILDKGAHPPACNPEAMSKQIPVMLENLGTDYIDLYMMHRDNTDVPVQEFIDVLNEHMDAGRIRAIGGSNWTLARIAAANAYAEANQKKGMVAISNNFSLARMVDPVWAGCVAASDPDSRAWLSKTRLALFPWSSQARGFFVRGHPDYKEDAEMVRCWYADDNFQRHARVREMAQEKGVEPIQIALAYVLCQPFPTFPLIGPRLMSETHSSMKGLEIELSADEMKWLNLEI